jgi:hypothetical protein
MTAAKKTDAAEPPKAESGIRPKRAEGVPSFILHGDQFGAPEEIRTAENWDEAGRDLEVSRKFQLLSCLAGQKTLLAPISH